MKHGLFCWISILCLGLSPLLTTQPVFADDAVVWRDLKDRCGRGCGGGYDIFSRLVRKAFRSRLAWLATLSGGQHAWREWYDRGGVHGV